jgi:hypothetical protein
MLFHFHITTYGHKLAFPRKSGSLKTLKIALWQYVFRECESNNQKGGAIMGRLSRQPTSNDPPRLKEGKSPWLGNTEFLDEFALLLSGLAKRCRVCTRATHIRHLDTYQRCPDCR